MQTCVLLSRESAGDGYGCQFLSQIFCVPVPNGESLVTGARKTRILILTSYYLPGLNSGGPLRSLLHIQEALKATHEFVVVTRNRDLGSTIPYSDTTPGSWSTVAGVEVWYLVPPHWLPGSIHRAIRSARPDLIYIQSVLDLALSFMPLLLRRLGLISKHIPVLLAPRGELSAGALSIKPMRKRIYLSVARVLGIFDDVSWHATSQEERNEILRLRGPAAKVALAPNLPSRGPSGTMLQRVPKRPGLVRLVFLSRISRKKNLHGVLSLLSGVKSDVQLDIYGNREDPRYWEECSALMAKLPTNIEVKYKGSVEPQNVIAVLSKYDVFLLPTLGENFGHVICEALVAGCPVVLSDKTPWRNLEEAQIGFDIPLDQIEYFRSVIGRFAMMDAAEFEQWSDNARKYGVQIADDPERIQRTREMLSEAIKS